MIFLSYNSIIAVWKCVLFHKLGFLFNHIMNIYRRWRKRKLKALQERSLAEINVFNRAVPKFSTSEQDRILSIINKIFVLIVSKTWIESHGFRPREKGVSKIEKVVSLLMLLTALTIRWSISWPKLLLTIRKRLKVQRNLCYFNFKNTLLKPWKLSSILISDHTRKHKNAVLAT